VRPADRPYPGDVVPDRADAEFWAACREGRLLVFQCGRCKRALWPAGACPDHGIVDMSWIEAEGRGTVLTWTVVHQRYPSSFADTPQTVAVVRLSEGAVLHAALIGPPATAAAVEVRFTDIGDEVVVPEFVVMESSTGMGR